MIHIAKIKHDFFFNKLEANSGLKYYRGEKFHRLIRYHGDFHRNWWTASWPSSIHKPMWKQGLGNDATFLFDGFKSWTNCESHKWHCNNTGNQCSWRRILIMCGHVCLHKCHQWRLMMYEGVEGLSIACGGGFWQLCSEFWVLGGKIGNGIEPSNLFCSNLWLTFLLFALLKNTRKGSMSITPDFSHLSVSPRFLSLTTSRLSDLSHSICMIPLADTSLQTVSILSLNVKSSDVSHVLNYILPWCTATEQSNLVNIFSNFIQLHTTNVAELQSAHTAPEVSWSS